MNFLEVNESTSLNTSITIHPPVPLPEDSANNSNNISLPKVEQETLNTTIQKLNLPHYISQCESASVATKSNYSSINNILPCPDSEHNRSRRDDNTYKPAEKSQFSNTLPPSSSNNPDISIMRQNLNLQTRLTTSDKPPMKTMSRPPLNPNEVAKGLSALHSKVDELLRKKSQPRGRDSSCGDSERQHRALSTDARNETKVPPQFILTSFQKEPPTPDILSGRTCHSIEIGFNKHQEEQNLSAQLNEQREIPSLKFNSHVYQDLSLKEKTASNPVTPVSPPKSKFHLSAKVTSFSPVVKGSFPLDSFKPNSTQPISIRNTEDSFDNKGEDRSRPRYDERKLDQIISRIKERSSVSPAPGPRGSITDADVPAQRYSVTSHNVSVNIGRRPQDSWTEKKEARIDERNDLSGANWQLNTCPADTVNQRDIHANVTTTMFETADKKRSISSPKFRDMPPAPESDKKNGSSFIRGVYLGNETTIQENKPVYGNIETKTYSNVPASNYTVADIIRELKANKTIKVNEPLKTESSLDRTRAFAQPETRTRAGDMSVNGDSYQEEKTLARNYKRGRESVSEKESLKVFGSLENDMDSVMEANRQKQVVMNSDADMEYKRYTTALQQGRHMGSQRKRSMDKVERPESNNGRRNVVERSERNVYEEESMTNRLEEDSLLDESVFLSKEETTVRGSTNRMFTSGNDERQNKRPKVCNRTELFNTPFRKKYLQDDTDLSDFDFDRSKMEHTERDAAKESFRGFMLKVNKVEEDSARKYDAKRQKRSSSISMSNEKIVPKTEMPRRGFVGRAGY